MRVIQLSLTPDQEDALRRLLLDLKGRGRLADWDLEDVLQDLQTQNYVVTEDVD